MIRGYSAQQSVRDLKREASRGMQPWTDEEAALLRASFEAGHTPIDLASRHCRTPAACVIKLERLGLLVGWKQAYYRKELEPYVTVLKLMNLRSR